MPPADMYAGPYTGLNLRPTYETGPSNLLTTMFTAGALRLRALRIAGWETSLDDVPDIAGESYRVTIGREREVLIERDGLIATVEASDGGVQIRVAAASDDEAELFIADMRDVFPATIPDLEAPEVPVTFWSYGQHGPQARRRRITVPPWDAVMSNYSRSTFRALDDVMDRFTPGAAGQLLLWHGPPGTGKTWALRALAWEWRAWCSLHYVTDPEQLFGEHASYLLDVLLSDDDDGGGGGPIPVGGPIGNLDERDPLRDPRADGGRWRLLVLEDTGELMSSDARERSGHGLGRLLNVVDGMIGQGLKVLVLVTTNEERGQLHPAVARAGRCAVEIDFEALPHDEAVEWLERRDADVPLAWGYAGEPRPETVTLADLYAILARQ